MKQLYIDKVEAVWEKLLVEQLFLIVEDCKRSIILFYYFVSFLNFPLLILFFPYSLSTPNNRTHLIASIHPPHAARILLSFFTALPPLLRSTPSSLSSPASFTCERSHGGGPSVPQPTAPPPQQLRPSPFAGARWRRWWGASMSTPPRLAQGAGRSCFF